METKSDYTIAVIRDQVESFRQARERFKMIPSFYEKYTEVIQHGENLILELLKLKADEDSRKDGKGGDVDG